MKDPFVGTREHLEKYINCMHEFVANHHYFYKYICYVFNDIVLENVCLCLSPLSSVRTGCGLLDI